jgi:3-hydroxyacyl-CoA dehydrogenase / 3-hydroxy-2-methylbutyryl-CoA dehydrogenase
MNLAKSVAFVTGAGQGLGRATALRLARGGAKVVVCDINAEQAQSTVDEIGTENAMVASVDVTDAVAVKSSMDAAVSRWGSLNIAVNCAGILSAGRTQHPKKGPFDLEKFNNVLKVNVGGTFNVIRLAAEIMSKQEPDAEGQRGVLVNTASIAAMDGQIGQVAYSASKGAIVGMTLPIARDLAMFGIRVATVAPGLFQTPMLAGLPEDARQALCAGVPFPSRLGKPDEYAQMVQQIIENPMLNGEVIRLDGALRMQP